jgi:ribosomal protein L18E
VEFGFMKIAELLPQLHNLSRNEKLKVIKFLVQDLERKEFDRDDVLLSRLAGTWTDADEAEFFAHTESFREIEENLWT